MTKPAVTRTAFLEKWCILHNANCDQSLKRLEFRVLCRLHYHHNSKSGQCNPAVGTIAKALGATPRGVRAALRALEAKGYILTRLGGGLNKSSQYQLCVVEPKVDPQHASSAPPEPQAPQTRKGSSSKTEKETNKKKQRIADDDKAAMEIAKLKRSEKNTGKVSAKSVGKVQVKLAAYLGEEGWDMLQKAGEKADDIYEQLAKRQINYREATKLLLEILDE